jgi:hypothetical protein
MAHLELADLKKGRRQKNPCWIDMNFLGCFWYVYIVDKDNRMSVLDGTR